MVRMVAPAAVIEQEALRVVPPLREAHASTSAQSVELSSLLPARAPPLIRELAVGRTTSMVSESTV